MIRRTVVYCIILSCCPGAQLDGAATANAHHGIANSAGNFERSYRLLRRILYSIAISPLFFPNLRLDHSCREFASSSDFSRLLACSPPLTSLNHGKLSPLTTTRATC